MMKKILLGLCALTFFAAAQAGQRLVVAGGSLVELLYAMGAGERIVGVDQSTAWPVETKALPRVGYWKMLSIEGILSLRPDIFITWQDSEPTLVMEQLQQQKVQVVLLPRIPATPEQMYANISTLAQVLRLEDKGRALVENIRQRLKQAAASNTGPTHGATALFLLSTGPGPIQVAGHGTVADSMLTLAGIKNLAEHQSYRSYSAEALIAANPQFIAVTSQMAAGDLSKIASIPGIDRTAAWRNKRIITIDQALILGMGPRIADAVESLHQQLGHQ